MEGEQIEQVWRAMLMQATQAGMSRLDITRLTVQTCYTMTRGTWEALWPDDAQVVPQESVMYSELLGLLGFTEATARNLDSVLVGSTEEQAEEQE